MKKISIIQPILDAIDETDESISRHMNQLIKWAKYCESSIGSLNGYPFKAGLFTVEGAIVKLPDDCYRVMKVFAGDHADLVNLRYLDAQSRKLWVENISDISDVEYVWQDLNGSAINKMLWEVVGDQLQMTDDYDGNDITMLYQYIQTDLKGYWLVNESHINAIKHYLIYQIAKKYQFANFKNSKLTRQADMAMVAEYKRNYNIAIRDARAQDQPESETDTMG
jgi:hypothetical protein